MKRTLFLIGLLTILFIVYIKKIGYRNPLFLIDEKKTFSCFLNKSYKIHLTFDDAPIEEDILLSTLNVLEKYQVLSTWFVLTSLIEKDKVKVEPLIRSIKNRGHQVSSHAHIHHFHGNWPSSENEKNEFQKKYNKKMYMNSKEEMVHSIAKSKSILEKIINEKIQFIRMPYGGGFQETEANTKARELSREVVKTVRDYGLLHLGWDIDIRDYQFKKSTIKSERIFQMLTDRFARQVCDKGGGIVLFHDGIDFTSSNLDKWIPLIRKAGHQLVKLDELYPKCYTKEEKENIFNILDFDQNSGVPKQCWNQK